MENQTTNPAYDMLVAAIVVVFVNILPVASAALGFLYLCVRLWETATVQKLWKQWRSRSNGEDQ